jgi:group II intron reverse transcriptase/maturase/CRISPR-associated endonuclease Cas1
VDGRIAQLLVLNFRLRRATSLHFFHGPSVLGLFHARLQTKKEDDLARGLRFLPVEQARTRYEAGDAYNLALAVLPEAAKRYPNLLAQLAECSNRGDLRNAALPGDLTLQQVDDVLLDRRIESLAQATWLERSHLQTQVEALAASREITLRMLAPLLILRAPVSRGETFMDGEVCDAAAIVDRVQRAVAEHYPELPLLLATPGVSLTRNGLLRAGTYYRGYQRGGKYIPGAVGTIGLQFETPMGHELALRFLLAGMLGIGRSTGMGLGRFAIEGAPLVANWPPLPASTLAERAARSQNFARAREALRHAGESSGVDEVERDDFIEGLSLCEDELARMLAAAQIKASPLRGLLFRQGEDKVRALAIPTMQDRFLQRAVVEELTPAIEELLEESSFAYRRGLSRHNAKVSVQRAYEEGFVHVLRADIRGFFDHVDWEVLHGRLLAFFGTDPIVAVIMNWVRAPVFFGDRLIVRERGLPQGAVISPLLANLYLDAFDEAIAAAGFRLARFADDFVILCREKNEVEAAKVRVQVELAKVRLELHETKTAHVDFAHGFSFLGFVFANSLVLNREAKIASESVSLGAEDAEELRPIAGADQGWLSTWLQQKVEKPSETLAPKRWRGALVAASAQRRHVYVVSGEFRLSASRRGLRLSRGDELHQEVAWATIAEVIVLGQRAISSGVFAHAMRERVPISLFSRAGKPLGMVLPNAASVPTATTYEHWRWHETSESTRLAIARELVQAKIHNQRLLVRHQSGDTSRTRDRLALLEEQVAYAGTIEKIRGYEGMAAHLYFSQWSQWLDPALGFRTRQGRGANDPVNALLNLLYTQLYHQCWLACLRVGLDPGRSVLHTPSTRYAALAADFQEPMRFLCDRLVLEAFHRNTLTRDDFAWPQKDESRCLLRSEALKRIVSMWERRLETRVKVECGAASYRQHIAAQAERFNEVIAGKRERLLAFRLKW